MKNSNLLNVRDLHNSDINLKILSKKISYTENYKNLDLLFDFLCSGSFVLPYRTEYFSVIGFDFDKNNLIRQVQPMVGYDLFEVLRHAYHDDDFGVHFNILHHDLNGFHYLVY